MNQDYIAYGDEVTIKHNYKLLPDIMDRMASYEGKGMTYIQATGEEKFLTYATIKERALKCLGGLQKAGIKQGDVILVETEEPEFFHVAFWACMYGGIIISSIAQPASWEPDSEAIHMLMKQLEKADMPIMVTQKSHAPFYDELEKSYSALRHLIMEALEDSVEGTIAEQKEDDHIFIQFSSGTTGTPEGVLLSHKNIISSSIGTAQIFDFDSTDICCSWLPHTHNLGLFLPVVIAMILENSVYFMTPVTFFRTPQLFLQKLSEHKVTWLATNNFGIEWMTNMIPEECLEGIDLSNLHSWFAGAENISGKTMDRFIEKFGKCGFSKMSFRPGYGMSEATLVITVTKRNAGTVIQNISRTEMITNNKIVSCESVDDEDCVSYTSNGVPICGAQVRIVDDEYNALPERTVGEVQAWCEGLFQGYINSSEKYNQVMHEGWLCTGDLGFLIDDHLYIVGRKKDVVIIRGVNYIVTDVEAVICQNTGIVMGTVAVAGVQVGNEEQLAVFVEYKDSEEKFVTLREQIIRTVGEHFHLKLEHVIPIDAIPKTNSGKSRRYLLKMQFEAGSFQNIAKRLESHIEQSNDSRVVNEQRTELEEIIVDCWSDVLKMEPFKISIYDSFSSLGGESVQAYYMLEVLSKKLNRVIEHEIIMKCKSVSDMAAYLEDQDVKKERIETESSCESDEKIAITGIGFRLPNAKTQEEFWQNLCNKKDSIQKISEERKKLAKDSEWSDWLGELSDVDSFDYDFFEISEKDAKFMDPQHRIMMEVAYEALEDAGMVTDSQEEKNVGVYAGICSDTYYPLVLDYIKEHGYDDVPVSTMVNNMNNIAAARISHQYGFTGPVMAIDTACSSFMTALHVGREALIHKETDGAVITGANLIVTSYSYELAKKAGIISSTNQSKVFDKDADGSILGEGIIVLYLERLNDAIKNNKNIYGVIYGSAVNNDGFALSITSPNPKGELEVIKEAYRNSDVSPEDVSYVEAHGTGTVIGDPIEINALSRVFQSKNRKDSIGIGSVKTNIGHLLPVAAGAGIVKVLMCLKHKELVPSLHMNNINPLLQIEKTPFSVVIEKQEWKPCKEKGRIAGISSLGLGGTNGHVIIGEYAKETVQDTVKTHLVTCSAKTEKALDQIVEDTMEMLKKPDVSIRDFCMTKNRYRKHYEQRVAFLVDANGNVLGERVSGTAVKTTAPKVSIFLGNLRETGTMKEFLQNVSKLHFYKQSINKFGKFYGTGSGKIYADYLNDVIDQKEAENLYINYQETKEDSVMEVAGKSDLVMGFGVEKVPEVLEQKSKKTMLGIFNKEENEILENLKELYVVGASINWEVLYPDGTGNMMNIPSYPFEKNSIWIS